MSARGMKATWAHAQRLAMRVGAKFSPKQRFQAAAFSKLREVFYDDFWRSAAADYNARIEHLGQHFYRISQDEHWTIVRESDVMLDDHLSLDLAGHKPIVNRLLAEAGFPTVCHLSFQADDHSPALQFLRELNGAPAVVKPAYGTGAGRGVTMGIATEKALLEAIQRAAQYRQQLLIEQQLSGHNYRLLYLNGELVDAIRRDPPDVIGDGSHTLAKRIAQENTMRRSGHPITSLHPIAIDNECRATLHATGLRLRDIPSAGRRIVVKNVVNQNAARNNHRVIERVHPTVVQLGADAVMTLGLKFVGLDLIAEHIEEPYDPANNNLTINELNTSPGLHHHVLIANRDAPAPVGTKLLDALLEGPNTSRSPARRRSYEAARLRSYNAARGSRTR